MVHFSAERSRMYNPSSVRIASKLAVLFLFGVAAAQSAPRGVSVWLIPAENAGPNEIAQGENIPGELDALRLSLEKTGVRLLNVEDPLAMKARSWNPQFSVPNFQVVATQRKTIRALQRFAEHHRVEVTVRLVTWDEAFGLLDAARTEGPDALPDVAQVGTSWAGYLAGKRRIRSRPGWESRPGNWRAVLDIPASALPFANDVRLLFYWKRLPSAAEDSKALELSGGTWQGIIESLQEGAGPGDTLVFPTGVTLNLLHDYFPLVWAGTAKPLLSPNRFLGSSIDLTSSGALSIPFYLAGKTRLPAGGGEFRRLISFPESSHEEVSRTFVNGGYRATIEPANFIGRWIQDFEERQKKRVRDGLSGQRFWDYAAAIVPPASFKGGSELVVLNNGQAPDMAFALADFLATDPEYTQVLAEAGHLPAGRPGYGIEELVGSLPPQDEHTGAREFSEAVQKAIDQGVKYPDLEEWPIVIENRLVQEQLQRVWRRMSEGDVNGVEQAAEDVQWAINSRLYLPARAADAARRSWPLLLLIAAISGTYAFRVKSQQSASHRRLTTLLHLYRASRHESAKILGDNIVGLHRSAVERRIDSEELIAKLSALGLHYTKENDGLAPHMALLGEELLAEIQGKRLPQSLHRVVTGAFNGAKMHFQASKLMEQPQATLVAPSLDRWRITAFPAMATVILQEWFFNCFREIHFLQRSGAVITVEVTPRRRGWWRIRKRYSKWLLSVTAPGHLEEHQRATLMGPASKGVLRADAHGLVLIRDIVFHAFGCRVNVTQQEQAILLTIPFPLELLEPTHE
jgi:hypothetical protein